MGEKRLLPDGAQFFPDGSVFHDKPYFFPVLFRVFKYARREGIHQLVGENKGLASAVFQRFFHGGVNFSAASQQKVLEFAQTWGRFHNHVVRIQAVPESQPLQDFDGQGAGTGAHFQQGQPPAAAGAGFFPVSDNSFCEDGGKRGGGGKVPALTDVFNGRGVVPFLRVVQGQLHESFQGEPAASGRDVV